VPSHAQGLPVVRVGALCGHVHNLICTPARGQTGWVSPAPYRVRDHGRSIGVLVQEMTIEEEQEWQAAAWLPSADEMASTSLAEKFLHAALIAPLVIRCSPSDKTGPLCWDRTTP